MRLHPGLLLFLLLNISSTAFAQPGEQNLQRFLETERPDSFCVYNKLCVGYITMNPDTCSWKDAQYLFWVRKGKFYLKKFARCETSPAYPIESANPFAYYLDHRSAIDTEEIRKPTFITYRKTSKGVDTILQESFVDHSCHQQLRIKINSAMISKSVDEYDLRLKTNTVTRGNNIYYEQNQETYTRQFIDELIEFVGRYRND